MVKWISAVVFTLFLVVCFLAKWILKYYSDNAIRKYVAWCIAPNSGLNLFEHIANAQVALQLPAEYCIIEQYEWDYVRIIVSEFQKQLVRSYFREQLTMKKFMHGMRGEDYFMYKITAFLHELHVENRFLDYDMHKKRLSYKEYGSWGGPLYDATYSLSDFGRTFFKLYYTTYLFCKESKRIDHTGNYYNYDSDIKEILDTQRISISRL